MKTLFLFTFLFFISCIKDDSSPSWDLVRNEVFVIETNTYHFFGINASQNISVKWDIISDRPITIDVVPSMSDLNLYSNGLSYINYPSLYAPNVMQYKRESVVAGTAQTIMINNGGIPVTVTLNIWRKNE